MKTCLNCGKPSTKVWEGVAVCDTCHKVATHILQKTARQMTLVLTIQKDVIRDRLVNGKLVLSSGEENEPDPGRVLAALHEHRMQEGPGDGGRGEPEPG